MLNHQESIRKRLTENQNLMLLALHKDGKLTIPELSELVGISQRNIQYAELLREAGAFELCISRLRASLPQMEEDEKRFAEHIVKLAEQGVKASFCLDDMFESEKSE